MKDYILAQKGNLNVNVFSYIFTRELIADLRFNPDLPYAEDAVFVMQALSKPRLITFLQIVITTIMSVPALPHTAGSRNWSNATGTISWRLVIFWNLWN